MEAPTETTAASDELVHSPVLDALEDFFSEPDFTSAINDFACMHAPTIVPLAEGEEHPIAYHAAFLEYQKLVEVNVETFLADNGYVENDIIVAALQAPPGVHTCIDYLMAATDYMAFLQLMSDFNQLSDAVES